MRVLLLGLCGWAAPLSAQATPPPPDQVEADAGRWARLEVLGDIWAKLFLFHPAGHDGGLDWNRVLADAIRPVESAASAPELVRVLNEHLFAPLGDPASFARVAGEGPDVLTPLMKVLPRSGSSMVRIDARDPRDTAGPDFPHLLAEAALQVGPGGMLVVDVRWPEIPRDRGGTDWLRVFLTSPADGLAIATRTHHGWSSRVATPWEWYRSEWRLVSGERVLPGPRGGAPGRTQHGRAAVDSVPPVRVPTVFIVNNPSLLDLELRLAALQLQSNVAVVYERTGPPLPEELHGYAGGVEVHFHNRLAIADSRPAPPPDLIRDARIADDEMEAVARQALQVAMGRSSRGKQSFLPSSVAPPRWPHTDGPLSREERLAGLISTWAVLERFYPYMEQATADWDRLLRTWGPRVEAAETLQAYYRVLNEVVALLGDGHARAVHPRMGFFGPYSIPAVVMRVEGKPVVVEVAAGGGSTTGLRVGDELLAIDGIPIGAVEDSLRPIVSAPRDVDGFMWGASLPLRHQVEGTQIELTVSDGTGVRTVRMARSVAGAESYDTTAVRMLEGGIGYVNLRALRSDSILMAAMEAFDRTGNGIVVDLRGYPAGSPAWTLVPYVIGEPVVSRGAGGGIPTASWGPGGEWRGWSMKPVVTMPDPSTRFRSPIVLLVDGRAGSYAETVAYHLATASNVTVVGTPTIGTNGGVTTLSLPGGGVLRFTGEKMVNGDGSRFHGIGVMPDVLAAPTIEGLRSGRDEVLERGVEVLRSRVTERTPTGQEVDPGFTLRGDPPTMPMLDRLFGFTPGAVAAALAMIVTAAASSSGHLDAQTTQIDSAVVAQIRGRLVPLSTVEAGNPFYDLEAFGAAVGDARVVALGEATHGTREIFQMKHRLLEYLVREKGFTVFAMEAPWPDSEMMDRYVKTGEGDPREALRAMHTWPWQTEEVVAMAEWMRAFNEAPGEHPILTFTSFDMQRHERAMRELLTAVAGAPEAATIDAAYEGLSEITTGAPGIWDAANRADSVVAVLERQAAPPRTVQLARLVAQAVRLRARDPSDYLTGNNFRDEMMARNVEWLLDVAHPGEKVVLWAHNGHIQTQHDSTKASPGLAKRPMGRWLRDSFGDQMYVLGFAIDTGTVRARRSFDGVVTDPIVSPLPPAGPGNKVLRAAGVPRFFLHFGSTDGPLAGWLADEHAFLDIGAGWPGVRDNTWWPRRLSESFDGLIYLRETHASELIEGALCNGRPCGGE